MTVKRLSINAAFLFLMLLACRICYADGCWGYSNGDESECTGPHGCAKWYTVSYCDLGCTSGACNPVGNTRQCCSLIIHYAEIVPDGDRCPDCGNIRTHLKPRPHSNPHRSELLQGRSPGLIMLSPAVSYKPLELVDVFRGCDRAAAIVIDGGRTLSVEGM